MSDEPLRAVRRMLDGLPVFVDPHVALTYRNPATGAQEPVAFWRFNNRILMHPERYREYFGED